jgi:hypothetical protein
MISGAPNPPQTLHEILLTTKAMAAHLRGFDIFHDDIDVKFQPAEGGAVGDVDLVLGVREKGRLFLKGGTEIGGGEGGAVGRMTSLGNNCDSQAKAKSALIPVNNLTERHCPPAKCLRRCWNGRV